MLHSLRAKNRSEWLTEIQPKAGQEHHVADVKTTPMNSSYYLIMNGVHVYVNLKQKLLYNLILTAEITTVFLYKQFHSCGT